MYLTPGCPKGPDDELRYLTIVFGIPPKTVHLPLLASEAGLLPEVVVLTARQYRRSEPGSHLEQDVPEIERELPGEEFGNYGLALHRASNACYMHACMGVGYTMEPTA